MTVRKPQHLLHLKSLCAQLFLQQHWIKSCGTIHSDKRLYLWILYIKVTHFRKWSSINLFSIRLFIDLCRCGNCTDTAYLTASSVKSPLPDNWSSSATYTSATYCFTIETEYIYAPHQSLKRSDLFSPCSTTTHQLVLGLTASLHLNS